MNNARTPTFSVAMATFNGAAHLREQLDSIAAQQLLPVELQIGDDRSTDQTATIVADFARTAPFPVHFHRNPVNLGYGQNFLDAASRCSGEWIAFSDQDDVWRPNKLARCAEAIAECGRADLLSIAHSADIVSDDLRPTGQAIPADNPTELKASLRHNLIWAHYGFAQLFRRELLTELGTKPRLPTHFRDIDRYPHDVWISGLSNVLGATLHLSDRLVLYRRHDRSVTQTGKGREGFSIAGLRATGADHYRHMAAVCRESTDCLRQHAGRITRADWRPRLGKGADAYQRLAAAYDRRADLYAGKDPLHRLLRLGDLIGQGDYSRLGASSFGWRSLAKDLAVALVGDRLSGAPSRGRGMRP